MGNIIYEVRYDRLYAAKEIIKPRVQVIHTNFYTPEGNTSAILGEQKIRG
jgi:hypothetical protein